MSKIKKSKKIVNGVYHKQYEEVLRVFEGRDKKAKIRSEIDEQVFDLNDSVADNAKWSAILTTAISIMYNALDEDTKARMDPRQRAIMDALVYLYSQTQTRFEIQYAKEGLSLITKMIGRQQKIANIIKKEEN